jgi:hypothetical protein
MTVTGIITFKTKKLPVWTSRLAAIIGIANVLDLFDNPVGYLTSLAISRPDTPFWGCEIAFF